MIAVLEEKKNWGGASTFTAELRLNVWLPWWLCLQDRRDLGSIPGLGRSPEEGNGNSFQCCCLENPIDRGAWLQSMGSQRLRHDRETNIFTFTASKAEMCESMT